LSISEEKISSVDDSAPDGDLLHWTNDDNQHAYYNQPAIKQVLPGFAVLGGLDSGCDIDAVFDYIASAKRLLEVGAGYGRVVDALLRHSFTGAVEVVERSDVFCEELKRFGDKITVHHQDVRGFKPDEPYDVVLSMWSGISDFPSAEQPGLVQTLSGFLCVGGRLILDTSVAGQKPLNARFAAEQAYSILKDGCSAKGYIPSEVEMLAYAKKASLAMVRHFTYITAAQRQRKLYVFERV